MNAPSTVPASEAPEKFAGVPEIAGACASSEIEPSAETCGTIGTVVVVVRLLAKPPTVPKVTRLLVAQKPAPARTLNTRLARPTAAVFAGLAEGTCTLKRSVPGTLLLSMACAPAIENALPATGVADTSSRREESKTIERSAARKPVPDTPMFTRTSTCSPAA